ncbi:class I SAM-dependent methyltransferase [Chloroflexota bacterium]
MSKKMLFDEWPERYDQWFTAPIGKLVKGIEADLIHELLDLKPGEKLLDAGCGTGIFTLDFLSQGAEVVGLDISLPMLTHAHMKLKSYPLSTVWGDMLYLPFQDDCFDKAVSVTALEFIEDANRAVSELFRVTRPGGLVVVATLNSLSPWATRRKAITDRDLFENALFRSPDELLACTTFKGAAKTCIHFQQDDDPAQAMKTEQSGQFQGLNTGAFVAARWQKPS